MESCFHPNAFCEGEACALAQPGSVRELNTKLWNDSCTCMSNTDFLSNATCSLNLIAYRYAPQTEAQREICVDQTSQAEVIVISVIAALFFALPLLLCLFLSNRARKRNAGVDAVPGSGEAFSAAAENDALRPLARLSFHSLCFSVRVPAENKGEDGIKHILNNLTASLEPQTLTAIMGPSGCGKSTLLDVLANRTTKATSAGTTITGQVLLNGSPRNDKYWKRISGYVTQFDVLFPCLTVSEMLRFSAMLRSSKDADCNAQVTRVIQDLELESCRDTKIGDAFTKGISGGQARRVTVGLELLANPLVLFLDEPTSGLDSTSAKTLVATLKRLTLQNRMTIACTIHQPRSSTFQLFDRLILIKTGELAYSGTLAAIPAYLKTNLGLEVDPSKVNLADFIVDLTYPREEDGEEDGAHKDDIVEHLVDAWNNSAEGQANASSSSSTSSALPVHKQTVLIDYIKSQSADGNSTYVQPLLTQVEILLHRGYLNASRNRGYHMALILQNTQYLFYGLLFVGLRIYSGLDPNPTSAHYGLVDLYRKNFLFQVMNTVCIVESVIISSAFLEKRLFYREYAASSYSTLAYHLTWYIRLTVDSIWKGALAAVLCYFFPGLRMEAQAFFFFALVLMVVSSLGASLGFCMACLINDVEGAANIHNTIIGFMGTYAGFYLPSLLIPIFTLWAYYLSFFKYSLEALAWNEFGPCASEYVLREFLSLDLTLNRWTNLLVLMAYPIIFHLLALLATLFMTGSIKCGGRRAPPQQEQEEAAPSKTEEIQLA